MFSSNRFLFRRHPNERGAALVELALIIPFLFGLVFAGIEFARAIRVAKMVSQLSRESANYALRECSPVWESPQACLEDVGRRSAQFADAGMSNVEVIVALYRRNPATGVIEEIGIWPPRPNRSAYCAPFTGCSREVDSTLVSAAGTIAVAEVFAGFTPIVKHIPQQFWFNPETMYEASFF